MAIRLSGLNSGLDTEAIVSAMVSAYSKKKEKYVKSQTKLGWKQDAWKSVNSKVYGLYKDINALRFTSAYSLKKTTVSDSTKASVTAAGSALNGSQELGVAQLAKAGYLTGGNLGSSTSGSTKLSSLIGEGGDDFSGGRITVTSGGKTTNIDVTKDTTVDQFVEKLNSAGVKASFDNTNKRIFISSNDSGKANDFTLDGANAGGNTALIHLGLYTKAKEGSAQHSSYTALAAYNTMSDEDLGTLITNLRQAHTDIADSTTARDRASAAKTYAENYKTVHDYYKDNTTKDGAPMSVATAAEKLEKLLDAGATKAAYVKSVPDGEDRYYTRREEVKDDDGNVTGYKYYYKDENDEEQFDEVEKDATQPENYDLYRNQLAYYMGMVSRTGEEGSYTFAEIDGKATAFLKAREGIKNYEKKAAAEDAPIDDSEASYIRQQMTLVADSHEYGTIQNTIDAYQTTVDDNQDIIDAANTLINNNKAIDTYRSEDAATVRERINAAVEALAGVNTSGTASASATRVDGQDGIIFLNNARFESSSNKYSINGLTINATGTTGSIDDEGNFVGDSVTITTATDVDGIYDKVKDFLSKYNEVVNNLQSLYNADSAKGYEPLTDEEKDQLSDTQAEKWEQKIKDSLLRRDQTLGNIMSIMNNAMSKSYMYNGKSYSLSSFGIRTLGYFNADLNEKYAYHIDGDEDDASTSTNQDKLKNAIENDPDAVINFMRNLTDGLYKSLDKQMKSTSMKSAYTVYNDKEMAAEYSNYTSLIKTWEDRITKMEDSYFKKFTAMEKALATMQSNSSSLTGLIGG